MSLTIKKATLWRRQLENRPGTLAEALKPFAQAGVNLQVVMGYTFAPEQGHAAVEVYPVADAKSEQAAKAAGLVAVEDTHCLIVEGPDRVGLGYDMANAISDAKINLNFAIVQVIGDKFGGVFGFASQEAATKAQELIQKVGELVKKA